MFIYRRRPDDKYQLIVPSTLVADVIRENHYPVYIAQVIKRNLELLALSFWWSRMCKTVEEYIRECDECQWTIANLQRRLDSWTYLKTHSK